MSECRYCGRQHAGTDPLANTQECREWLAERVESLTRERDALQSRFDGEADRARRWCQEAEQRGFDRDAAIKRATDADQELATTRTELQANADARENRSQAANDAEERAERRGKLLERWLVWDKRPLTRNEGAGLFQETEEELRQ